MTARRKCPGPWCKLRPTNDAQGSVVEYRYALAAQPGREQQAIHIVRAVPRHLFHPRIVHRAGFAEPQHAHRPGERRTAGGDFEPEDPLVGLGVRECPELMTRIDALLGHHQAEVHRRAEADVKIARIDCARAQLAGRHIADADVHRDVGGQAESIRDIGQEPTGHVSSGADGGKLAAIYPRRLTRIAVPVAGVMGEKPIGRCPGVIGDRHAGEMQDDSFLAVQQLGRAGIHLGRSVTEPENLRHDVFGGYDRGESLELLTGRHHFGERPSSALSALIQPADHRYQRLA